MHNKLNKLITPAVLTLYKALGTSSDLHIVGGAVRDIITGKEPKDIDVSTILTPNLVLEKLEEATIPCIPIGIRRGTVAAYIDHELIEITTFRNPENEKLFVDSIITDLAARDFTINAMAYSVESRNLIDPYHGLIDLKHRLVKAVGNPEKRFSEDPHRMLRFIRFCYSNDFTPDLKTEQAVKKLSSLLSIVSKERIRMELIKVLENNNIELAFTKMYELGLLEHILPELVETVGITQNIHHIYDVFVHTLKVMDGCDADYQLRMAALIHDLGKVKTKSITETGEVHFYQHDVESVKIGEELLTRLKFPTREINFILKLVANHMRSIPTTLKSMRKLIKDFDLDVEYWVALKKADLLGGKPVKHELEKIWNDFDKLYNDVLQEQYKNPKKKLEVNGNDLKNLGLKEGPEIGRVLKLLEDFVLENPDNNTFLTLISKSKEVLGLH